MTYRLLICDLDNTLYDWVSFFVPAFYAMATKASEISEIPLEKLLQNLKNVHIQNQDTEHPFALLDAECLKRRYNNLSRTEIAETLDPAFYEFNRVRKNTLRLYPQVLETLKEIKSQNINIVAYTDGKLFSVLDRIKRLGLEGFFSHVYCRERSMSLHPRDIDTASWIGSVETGKIVELHRAQSKPDPEVLLEICEDEGVPQQEAIYVGDSLTRDVYMAHQARVDIAWARYGRSFDAQDFDKLVQISHWTQREIAQEEELRERAANLQPNYVLKRSFSEILNIIRP